MYTCCPCPFLLLPSRSKHCLPLNGLCLGIRTDAASSDAASAPDPRQDQGKRKVNPCSCQTKHSRPISLLHLRRICICSGVCAFAFTGHRNVVSNGATSQSLKIVVRPDSDPRHRYRQVDVAAAAEISMRWCVQRCGLMGCSHSDALTLAPVMPVISCPRSRPHGGRNHFDSDATPF